MATKRRVAFSHYGACGDISGVTTWLRRLLLGVKDVAADQSLRLHHFGSDVQQASLLNELAGWPGEVSGIPFPETTGEGVRDILEFLNHVRPHVFLPQALPAPHFAAQLAEAQDLPWVFTIHSDDPEYWALADACGPQKGKGVWVAVSKAIAEEAFRIRPDADIRTIPYGVEIPDSTATWSDSVFRVVFCGRLVETQKRVSRVLDVLLAACREEVRIEAIFLGDGSERAKLKSRVADLGLGGRVRFLGQKPPDEVAEILTESHAIILMSDFEGLPVSLLEGMSCGVVPVVRKMRSGVSELVEADVTGLLLDDDPEVAAQAIVSLASDRPRWKALSSGARELIRTKFSLQSNIEGWASLIDELAGASKPSYPILTPATLVLPDFDQRLARLDRRRKSSQAQRLFRKFCNKISVFSGVRRRG